MTASAVSAVEVIDVAFADTFPLDTPFGDRMCLPTFVDAVLTPDECALVTDSVVSPWEPSRVSRSGTIEDDATAVGRRSDVVRSADLAVPPASAHDLLRDRVLAVVLEVNRRDFGFELSGVVPSDSFSMMRYDAQRGGHFAPHRDVGSSSSTRKLSVTVQLTAGDEYLGGDLLFPFLGRAAPRTIGAMVVFPAFLTHTVTTVTAGRRHAQQRMAP